MTTTWVEGAAGSLFDVDNLPYGVFSRGGEEPRVGVRIGDAVLDVAPVAAAEMLDVHHVFEEASLNALMSEGRRVRSSLRTWLTGLLTDPTERARTLGMLAGLALRAMESRDLDARLEAVERVLKLRKDADKDTRRNNGR